MIHLSQLLFESVIDAPLLIGDLPESQRFDRSLLSIERTTTDLNINQKLGHLYEDTLNIVMNASPKIDVLDRNLQIFDDHKQTIGELDFIVFDREKNSHIHLELGVKFYLAHKKNNSWHFPGPNDRDNWLKKLARLRQHQLCLTHKPETQKILFEKHQIDHINVQQLIYGCLFIPISHSGPQPKLEFMNKNARTGYWLYKSEWYENFKDCDQIYMIPKALWPIIPAESNIDFLVRYETKEFIDNFQEKGAMFTLPDCSNTYFLAPNDWPKT